MLASLDPAPPASLLGALRRAFALTTVEELVTAVSRGGAAIKEQLGASDADWESLLASARASLPDSVRTALETPLPSRHSTGAVLGRRGPDDLRRYLSH
jgi:hypothetical protein